MWPHVAVARGAGVDTVACGDGIRPSVSVGGSHPLGTSPTISHRTSLYYVVYYGARVEGGPVNTEKRLLDRCTSVWSLLWTDGMEGPARDHPALGVRGNSRETCIVVEARLQGPTQTQDV